MGLLQQVPHLNAAVLLPNEEDSRPGAGPAALCAPDLRAVGEDNGSHLKDKKSVASQHDSSVRGKKINALFQFKVK